MEFIMSYTSRISPRKMLPRSGKLPLLLLLGIVWWAGCSTVPSVSPHKETPPVEPSSPATVAESVSADTSVKLTHRPDPEALRYFMDGQLYVNQGQYARAIIEFQDALDLDPKASAIHVSLAECYWNLGKTKRAESHLLTALKLDSLDLEARNLLVNQYLATHRYEEAEKQLQILKVLDPDNTQHLLTLGDIALSRKQWDAAIEYYEQAYEKDPSLIGQIEKVAELALRTRQFNRAETLFKRLATLDQQNVQYLATLADLAVMNEDYQQAIEAVKKIINLEGPSVRRWVQLGAIYYQAQQPEEARNIFLKAYDPENLDANVLHYLVTLYLEEESYNKAQVFADSLTNHFPEDPRGFADQALIALSQHQPQKANEVLAPVSNRFQDEFMIQYLLGNSYYQTKSYSDAEPHLRQALALNPKSRNAQHTLAIILDSQGRWTESDSLYELLIATDSLDAQAYNNFAYSLATRSKDLPRALEMAKKAIKLEVDNAAYLDTIGWIYFKLGELDKALSYLRDSVTLVDTNAVVLEHLGDILMKMNQEEEALEIYRKAVEYDQSNELLQAKAYPQ